MKYFFPGILGVFLFGWAVQVLGPFGELGKVDPLADADTGEVYPHDTSGLGRQVYAANGCVSCHTQQVRSAKMGADLERRWGTRRSVARDYLYEDVVFLGNVRLGPDLASIGTRDIAQTGAVELTSAAVQRKLTAWHYLHLFNPRVVQPLSKMPAYPWLFVKRPIQGQSSDLALALDPPFAPPAGYEIVPKPEAQALVAYLLSLNQDYSLPESRKSEVKTP